MVGQQKWLEQLEHLRSEDTPPRASWLPILLSHIGSQVKRRQSQSYKFEEFVKISNFQILKQTLQATHLLKLLDKMCKYEMDPTSIRDDTKRTRCCPQTDRRTDGQGETSIPLFQLRWSGGYNKCDTSSNKQTRGCLINNQYATFRWPGNVRSPLRFEGQTTKSPYTYWPSDATIWQHTCRDWIPTSINIRNGESCLL